MVGLTLVILAGFVLLSAAVGIAGNRIKITLPSLQDPPGMAEMSARIDQLSVAVSEGIQHVGRAEKRIAATIRSARAQLAESGYEDPRVEAEASQLELGDAGRGEIGPVQPVPAIVEADTDPPSSIPGVSSSQLARVRGYA